MDAVFSATAPSSPRFDLGGDDTHVRNSMFVVPADAFGSPLENGEPITERDPGDTGADWTENMSETSDTLTGSASLLDTQRSCTVSPVGSTHSLSPSPSPHAQQRAEPQRQAASTAALRPPAEQRLPKLGGVQGVAGEEFSFGFDCQVLSTETGEHLPATAHVSNYRVRLAFGQRSGQSVPAKVVSIPLTSIDSVQRVDVRQKAEDQVSGAAAAAVGRQLSSPPTAALPGEPIALSRTPSPPLPAAAAASPIGSPLKWPDEEATSPARDRKEPVWYGIQTKGVNCVVVRPPAEYVPVLRELGQQRPGAEEFCYTHRKHTPTKEATGRRIGFESEAVVRDFQRQAEQCALHGIEHGLRIAEVNRSFEACESYPAKCVVPASADNDLLLLSRDFRKAGRFPICSYVNAANGAKLFRSSQPRLGVRGRCEGDERLLELMSVGARKEALADKSISDELGSTMEDTSAKGVIVFDCRGSGTATLNRVKGGGYESTKFYSGVKCEHLNMENIHVVSSSLAAMRKLVKSPPSGTGRWEIAFVTSRWPRHIERCIRGASRVAAAVAAGKNCLVHCSDGWDRTTQIVSLAKIMLDPYYRTIQGFLVLIECDWLACGHKFSDRNYNVEGCRDRSEGSPIFLQWLDVVWQMWKEYPVEFQFTESFLVWICNHSTSGRFGNFLFKSEAERRSAKLAERTVSAWDALGAKMSDGSGRRFVNALFCPSSSSLSSRCRPRQILYWSAVHSRPWGDHSEAVAERVSALAKQLEVEKARVRALKSQLRQRPGRRRGSVNVVLPDADLQLVPAAAGALDESPEDSIVEESVFESVRWVPDCEAACCVICLRPFSLFRRRHHCRCCGNVFCDDDSRYQGTVPGHTGARLCGHCFDLPASKRVCASRLLASSGHR
eukprot:TRINITY_DN24784_c0_g2_i2.p1 TRINITY_DN24784_c0_g2~~TRINITY_DN24784_c0_g2_i2.p1  ORF type:complete len:895 (+),score=122.10 TRINITY_DN24784_c0_g2_i2:140-2824(+)